MRQPAQLGLPYRTATTPGGTHLSPPEPRFPPSWPDRAIFTGSRSGSPVPGWKRKLANHESATSPYSAQYYRAVTWEPGYDYRIDAWLGYENGKPFKKYRLQQSTLSSLGMRPTFSFLTYSNQELAKVENMVASALLSAENSARVKADALVTMGEFAESLAMLKAPIKQVPKLIRRYLNRVDRRMKRAEKRGTRLSVEQLNSMYLGWFLGVSPLIGEIESYAEAVASAALKESYTVVQATVRAPEKSSVSTLVGSTSGRPFSRLNVDTLRSTIRAKSGIRISLDAGDVASRLLAATNLDGRQVLGRFIPSMWELIPFSFVLDYFGNFGEVIDSRYGVRTGLVWQSMTRQDIAVSRRELHVNMFSPGTIPGATELESSIEFPFHSRLAVERKTISRKTSIPSVSFELELPSLYQTSITASLTVALSGLARKADKMIKRHYNK